MRVLEVKLDRQQIALSLKLGADASRAPSDSGARADHRGGRPQGQAPRQPAPPPQKQFFNSPFAGLEKLRGK